MPELIQYRDQDDAVPYEVWENDLPAATAARITKYVKRMENGNFGNSEPVGRHTRSEKREENEQSKSSLNTQRGKTNGSDKRIQKKRR